MGTITVRDVGMGDWPIVWEMLYETSFALDEPKPSRERIHERRSSATSRSGVQVIATDDAEDSLRMRVELG